jgi:hypothetical protein
MESSSALLEKLLTNTCAFECGPEINIQKFPIFVNSKEYAEFPYIETTSCRYELSSVSECVLALHRFTPTTVYDVSLVNPRVTIDNFVLKGIIVQSTQNNSNLQHGHFYFAEPIISNNEITSFVIADDEKSKIVGPLYAEIMYFSVAFLYQKRRREH